MGGVMTLESEVGVGSTFGFIVPIGESAGPARPENLDARDPLVVVIDDDRTSLDLMSAYLDGHGVRVVRARNGTEGLDTVRRMRPVAVVLDIRLPGIDGWEVLAQLRSDPATQTLPVIIVTILDEKSRGIAAGAAEYQIKPVGRVDQLGALRRVQVLPGHGTGRSI
jgi:CheY-like chemotaxis protein